MSKPTLALKATVTKRFDTINPNMKDRLADPDS